MTECDQRPKSQYENWCFAHDQSPGECYEARAVERERELEDKLKVAELQLCEYKRVVLDKCICAEGATIQSAPHRDGCYYKALVDRIEGMHKTNVQCTCPETKLRGAEKAICPWCISQRNA